MVRTSLTNSALSSCANFFRPYHILASSVIYYLTDVLRESMESISVEMRKKNSNDAWHYDHKRKFEAEVLVPCLLF